MKVCKTDHIKRFKNSKAWAYWAFLFHRLLEYIVSSLRLVIFAESIDLWAELPIQDKCENVV